MGMFRSATWRVVDAMDLVRNANVVTDVNFILVSNSNRENTLVSFQQVADR